MPRVPPAKSIVHILGYKDLTVSITEKFHHRRAHPLMCFVVVRKITVLPVPFKFKICPHFSGDANLHWCVSSCYFGKNPFSDTRTENANNDDIHFTHYCLFMKGIHRSSAHSHYKQPKGRQYGAYLFNLILALNVWVAGDLRQRGTYVTSLQENETFKWALFIRV